MDVGQEPFRIAQPHVRKLQAHWDWPEQRVEALPNRSDAPKSIIVVSSVKARDEKWTALSVARFVFREGAHAVPEVKAEGVCKPPKANGPLLRSLNLHNAGVFAGERTSRRHARQSKLAASSCWTARVSSLNHALALGDNYCAVKQDDNELGTRRHVHRRCIGPRRHGRRTGVSAEQRRLGERLWWKEWEERRECG